MRKTLALIAVFFSLFLIGAGWPVDLQYRFEIEQPFRYRIEYKGEGTYASHTGQKFVPRPLSVEFRSRFLVKTEPLSSGGPGLFKVALKPEGISHTLTRDVQTDKVVMGPGILTITRGGKTVIDANEEGFWQSPIGLEYKKLQNPVVLGLNSQGVIHATEGLNSFSLLLPQVSLEEVLYQNFLRLPSMKLSKRARWTSRYPLKLPHCPDGTCQMTVQHRVIGEDWVRGFQCIYIELEAEVDLASGDFDQPSGIDLVSGTETQYNYFYQKVTGQVAFARKEGLVIKSDLKIHTSYNAEIAVVENGLEPTRSIVDLDLTVDSQMYYDGERQPENFLERLRMLIP